MLVPTVTDRIDAALIAQAGENLKLIANFGNGVDKIDVAAAGQEGHHRHQHAQRADRGHGRHDHGADAGRAAAADGRRQCARPATRNGPAGRRPGCSAGASGASGSASSAWAASAPRLPGAPRPSACRSTTTTAIACCRPSRTSWRRPTGKASTRCWPAWTSSRSTARRRRRPSICCRRGGWR